MGTSKSAADLVRKLNGLATATERSQAEIVGEGALATKTIFLATAAARGVTPQSLIAGKRWNVRYNVNAGRAPSALVRFTGPFHLVESATKPHTITPRTRGRRSGARALRIGDNFRASASHPGTPGKHIFKAARVLAGDRVQRVMAARMSRLWGSTLR